MRKIIGCVHFFFEKLRISEKYYAQLLQDANMWHLIGGAIKCHVETDTFDVKGGRDVTLMSFDKKRDYTLEIDAVKIRNMFFKTDLPVKIIIKE